VEVRKTYLQPSKQVAFSHWNSLNLRFSIALLNRCAFGADTREINEANAEMDKLVGVRTRIIQRKLKEVQELPEGESTQFLEE
jgi:hypothetical protein